MLYAFHEKEITGIQRIMMIPGNGFYWSFSDATCRLVDFPRVRLPCNSDISIQHIKIKQIDPRANCKMLRNTCFPSYKSDVHIF